MIGTEKIANLKNIKSALQALSYRGYDSVGIAFVSNDGRFFCFKSPGLVDGLFENLDLSKHIKCAIGHTRWATHGDPTIVENAHPHIYYNVSVVHNGTIDNYEEIKKFLIQKGLDISKCNTDSSFIPALINHYLNDEGLCFLEAVKKSVSKLEGIATIIAMLVEGSETSVVAFKRGAPLVLGVIDEKYAALSSDIIAISNMTNKFIFFEDGDFAHIDKNGCFKLMDYELNTITREEKLISSTWSQISKGQFKHYMMKEISEIPSVFARIISTYWDKFLNSEIDFSEFASCNEIALVGCGSSYYACFIAAFWFQNIAKIKTKAFIASELSLSDSSKFIFFVSQSGETADILSVANSAKKFNFNIYGIVNIFNSALSRIADKSFDILAGPEISVPTTKVFVGQMAILFLIAIKIANIKFCNVKFDYQEIFSLQYKISSIIEGFEYSFFGADVISKAKSAIYIASGELLGVAMEGALKLKEITYIHAEAIPAGELKHGSLALIENNFPVFVLCPSTSSFFKKLLTTIEEISARKGFVIAITDEVGKHFLSGNKVDSLIVVPNARGEFMPFLCSVVVQLISYKIALMLNKNIDKPRNLAKSVTVE